MTVIDAFCFSDEFDLLEIRLSELSSVVDRFVLVEASRTFTGRPKPLHFSRNRARYAAWAERITYVAVGDMPSGAAVTAWQREAHQRNAIVRGLDLAGVPNDATVLVSDCDEIPHPDAVQRAHAYRQALPFPHNAPPLSFVQVLSFYHLNNRCITQPQWYGTQAATAGQVRGLGAEIIRTNRHRPRDVLGYAGWHATNLGSPDWLRNKIKSFSHTECDTPAITDRDHLARCIERGVDPSGRTDIQFAAQPIDGSYPQTVLRDIPRWRHLFTPGSVEALAARMAAAG